MKETRKSATDGRWRISGEYGLSPPREAARRIDYVSRNAGSASHAHGPVAFRFGLIARGGDERGRAAFVTDGKAAGRAGVFDAASPLGAKDAVMAVAEGAGLMRHKVAAIRLAIPFGGRSILEERHPRSPLRAQLGDLCGA